MSSPNLIWHLVADIWQLQEIFPAPHQVHTFQVGNKQYCIGRLGDGYFAVTNKCPHAGGSLGDGKCDATGVVTCPFHRYQFSLKTGMMVNGQGYYVDTFPVEMREDGLYIGLKKKKFLGLF